MAYCDDAALRALACLGVCVVLLLSLMIATVGYTPRSPHLPSNCLLDSNITFFLSMDDNFVSSTYVLVEDRGLVGWRVLIKTRRDKREMDLIMNGCAKSDFKLILDLSMLFII